ncbi:MAG: excinuclease ABC subunit UvrC [Patescibacteria group bacterium]
MSRLAKKIREAPRQPGCYLFKNKAGRIIYIGKAKNLRNRVGWYFRKENQIDKTLSLVREIADVEYFVTDSEVEALLLESGLIKKYQPKYNIDLKSGVRYAYIKITKEKFPRLVTERYVKKGDELYGPYISGFSRQEMIRLAERLFKLRINKRMFKKDLALGRIRLATSPWIQNVTEPEYTQRIEAVRLLLKGQTAELIKKLTGEMKDYSNQLNYEMAAVRRNQISALQNISEKQKISLRHRYDQDVINYFQLPNHLVIQLFNINKGVISGRKELKIKVPLLQPVSESLSEFMQQYYYANEIPQEIILPQVLVEQNILEKYLSKLAKRSVIITVPKKGDKFKLLELVKKNLLISLKSGQGSLVELQEILKLPVLPRVIECFDISNLGPTNMVGSMVQFRDGRSDKNNYRRFKIKTVEGQSDFDAMKEVVYRRYYGLIQAKAQFPDLIMVDGGKPQLSAALASLKQLGLQVPLIALAKKQEEIFTLNHKYPIRLPAASAALKQIQRIRDEAHRFAISYHRLLRSKKDFS